jgi:hypothetical protein
MAYTPVDTLLILQSAIVTLVQLDISMAQSGDGPNLHRSILIFEQLVRLMQTAPKLEISRPLMVTLLAPSSVMGFDLV